jgi:TatD DNase family protein
MIDTHAHLHLPQFDSDRSAVLARDFALGVTGIVEVSISPERWGLVRELIEGDSRIVATAGIHPHEAGGDTARFEKELLRLIAHPRVVAVGETGLDAYRDYAPLEEQRRLLARHVGLARETGLPLVIHCREAFSELLPILDREGGDRLRGVFHCFSGTPRDLEEVHGRGFFVGIGGAVTYHPRRWAPLLAQIPRSALLLETDCPYLKPAPERSGRNEPAWVFRTAEVVAELSGLDLGELEAMVDANAVSLFGPHWHRPGGPDGGAIDRREPEPGRARS